MRIYKVAHENIVCPKNLRKVEIEIGPAVIEEIRNSVTYEDMLCDIPLSFEDDEAFLNSEINDWLQKSLFDLLINKYFDLGDYTLIVED